MFCFKYRLFVLSTDRIFILEIEYFIVFIHIEFSVIRYERRRVVRRDRTWEKGILFSSKWSSTLYSSMWNVWFPPVEKIVQKSVDWKKMFHKKKWDSKLPPFPGPISELILVRQQVNVILENFPIDADQKKKLVRFDFKIQKKTMPLTFVLSFRFWCHRQWHCLRDVGKGLGQFLPSPSNRIHFRQHRHVFSLLFCHSNSFLNRLRYSEKRDMKKHQDISKHVRMSPASCTRGGAEFLFSGGLVISNAIQKKREMFKEKKQERDKKQQFDQPRWHQLTLFKMLPNPRKETEKRQQKFLIKSLEREFCSIPSSRVWSGS